MTNEQLFIAIIIGFFLFGLGLLFFIRPRTSVGFFMAMAKWDMKWSGFEGKLSPTSWYFFQRRIQSFIILCLGAFLLLFGFYNLIKNDDMQKFIAKNKEVISKVVNLYSKDGEVYIQNKSDSDSEIELKNCSIFGDITDPNFADPKNKFFQRFFEASENLKPQESDLIGLKLMQEVSIFTSMTTSSKYPLKITKLSCEDISVTYKNIEYSYRFTNQFPYNQLIEFKVN